MNIDLLKKDLSSRYDYYRKRMESTSVDGLIVALQRYNEEITGLSKSYAIDEINNTFQTYVEQLDNTTLKLAWYDCDCREQMKTFCNTCPIQLDEFQLKNYHALLYGILGGGGLLSFILLLCSYKWWALAMLCMTAAGGGSIYSGSRETTKSQFIKDFEEYAQSMEDRIINWIKTVENECLNKINEFKAKNHE